MVVVVRHRPLILLTHCVSVLAKFALCLQGGGGRDVAMSQMMECMKRMGRYWVLDSGKSVDEKQSTETEWPDWRKRNEKETDDTRLRDRSQWY